MTDLVWNYDLTQCPRKVLCQFKSSKESLPVIGDLSGNGSSVLYFVALESRTFTPEAWAPYTPPKEPEVWIKHDGKSWPQCNPRDKVKIIREDGNIDEGVASHFYWDSVWGGENIEKYCIVERAE